VTEIIANAINQIISVTNRIFWTRKKIFSPAKTIFFGTEKCLFKPKPIETGTEIIDDLANPLFSVTNPISWTTKKTFSQAETIFFATEKCFFKPKYLAIPIDLSPDFVPHSDRVRCQIGAAQMKVELTRFRIKPDKIGRVDEWLRMLNARIDECVATLEREKMFVEVVFRERYKNEDFLYWFTIQHESGEALESSPHEIDKIHHSFGRECIDLTYGAVDPLPQVIMIPKRVAAAMDWMKPHEAGALWTGAETWRPIKPKDTTDS